MPFQFTQGVIGLMNPNDVLTDADIANISAMLSGQPTQNARVTAISLESAKITQEQLGSLSSAIKASTSLETLNLSGIALGAAVTRVAESVRASSSLQNVNVSNCRLDDTAARAFSFCIVACISLRRLNLSGNAITAVGAGYFRDAFSNYNPITLGKRKPPNVLVNLAQNQLTPEELYRFNRDNAIFNHGATLTMFGGSTLVPGAMKFAAAAVDTKSFFGFKPRMAP